MKSPDLNQQYQTLDFSFVDTRRSIFQLLNFAFVDSCLNLLHYMQKCRIGPVVIQIGTKYKPISMSTVANASSIFDGVIFCPDFFIA